MEVDFVVSTEPLRDGKPPVIGVDGPVRGADLCFDHHATGEPVNLLAVPEVVPWPGTIATTSLDSDAVISAAVVLLRAGAEHGAVRAVWAPLYEAAHFCDHLIPSGRHPEAERAGLGLHCWLKERGFARAEALARAAGEVREDSRGQLRPAPSSGTKGTVFKELTLELLAAIRRGSLPCDFRYLDRLAGMEEEARRGVRQVDGRVTVLVLDGYVDPLALYRVVDTDVVVVVGAQADGTWRYSIGVHPRAYGRVDLGPVFARLNAREPGWGGRSNAGGSPLGTGSRVSVDELVRLLNTEVGREENLARRLIP
jgi:hypothetical protein